MPESLHEAGGRDEIQIMIQFDLHSRELEKNKLERRKDKKKNYHTKTGIVGRLTFVDLHKKIQSGCRINTRMELHPVRSEEPH